MDAAGDKPYWSLERAALETRLKTGAVGLSSQIAKARLLEVGTNSVEDSSRLSGLRLLLRQFESPLVLILVFAAVVSFVLQQWVDGGIVLAIVVGSSLLSFSQEYRASQAVEDLKQRVALTTRVMRDGAIQSVPVSTIVPGDLILLTAGNLIPADGLVVEAVDFLVSESGMTGESFPLRSARGPLPPTPS